MAQAFKFRLATVLRVRELREREAKRRVGAKAAEIARLDQQVRRTQEEIFRQQNVLTGLQDKPSLDPAALRQSRAWIAHLRHEVGQLHVQRSQEQAALEILRKAHQEARVQTRILEKLRERRWSEYRHERASIEQGLSDELAQTLHLRFASSDEAPEWGPDPS